MKGVKEMHSRKRGLGDLTTDQIVIDADSHVKILNLMGLRKPDDAMSTEELHDFYQEDYDKVVDITQ